MDLGNNTVFSDSPEELWRRKSCLPVAMIGGQVCATCYFLLFLAIRVPGAALLALK